MGRLWPISNPSDLDIICPCYEQSGRVLPIKGTFEKIGTGTVRWSVDKSDPLLGVCVVYLDALFHSCQFTDFGVDVTIPHKVIDPCNEPAVPSNLVDRAFSGMEDLLFMPQPAFLLQTKGPSHTSANDCSGGSL